MEPNTITNKDYILQRSSKNFPDNITFVYGNPRFRIINESDTPGGLGRIVACHQLGYISSKRMEELNQIPLIELPDCDRFNYERLPKEEAFCFMRCYHDTTIELIRKDKFLEEVQKEYKLSEVR